MSGGSQRDELADRTDAERLRSAEITLATLRGIAERSLEISADQDAHGTHAAHARGYEKAMRVVVAVLDSRWLPEGQPVHLPG